MEMFSGADTRENAFTGLVRVEAKWNVLKSKWRLCEDK